MNTKIGLWSKLSVVILSISLLFSACGEDKYYTEYIFPDGNFAEVITKYVTVPQSAWRWSEANGRYEASVDFPELEKGVYDDGFAVGNIFIYDNNGGEKLANLPYVKTWIDDASGALYTETISCELSLSKRTVDFYIETSDKFRDDSVLSDYEFKVGVVVNFVYER